MKQKKAQEGAGGKGDKQADVTRKKSDRLSAAQENRSSRWETVGQDLSIRGKMELSV